MKKKLMRFTNLCNITPVMQAHADRRRAGKTLGPALVLVIVASLLQPAACRAAGFLIFEAGARALGMGGAMTAQADDPSAIFFNPAGIAQLDGTRIYVGGSLIFVGTDFAGVDPDPGFGNTESTGTLVFPPVNAYLTYSVEPGFTMGIGLFNPFGLGQDWENAKTFAGRRIADDVDLKSFYVNPTLAWQIHPRLSIGIGLQVVYSTVELHRFLQRWDPNGSGFLDVGTLALDGDNGLDFGYNAGVKIEASDDVSIGASFRSRVTADFNGDADFTQIASGNPALDAAVAPLFPVDQGVETQVNFPWLLSVATAYKGIEGWTFEVDFNVTGWSEFDKLGFAFAADSTLNSVRVQDYSTKLAIRTGAAYEATETVTLRGGYYYDPTPQPRKAMSPLLADSDRHGITLGIGYHPHPWSVDAFGLVLITDERSTKGKSLDNYDGTYSTFGNLFGLNFGYEF